MKPVKLSEFVVKKLPNLPEILLNGLLPKGHVMFLYGEEGVFKSWLSIYMAISVSLGHNWLH